MEGETIIHKGAYAKPGAEFALGDTVKLVINKDKRVLNARLHSSGHLLDMCFRALGFTNGGTKGYHFPDAPYVEFSGKLGEKEREKLKVDLQNKIIEVLKNVVETDTVHAKVYKYDEAGKILGTVPSYLKVGTDVRLVQIATMDKPGPCGGTHVRHIKEIGGVKIEKVKNASSKAFKIYYQVVDSI